MSRMNKNLATLGGIITIEKKNGWCSAETVIVGKKLPLLYVGNKDNDYRETILEWVKGLGRRKPTIIVAYGKNNNTILSETVAICEYLQANKVKAVLSPYCYNDDGDYVSSVEIDTDIYGRVDLLN